MNLIFIIIFNLLKQIELYIYIYINIVIEYRQIKLPLLLLCFWEGKLKIFIEMNRLNQSKLHLWIMVGHLSSTLKLETFLACLARLWNTLLPWCLTCENLNLLKALAIRFFFSSSFVFLRRKIENFYWDE